MKKIKFALSARTPASPLAMSILRQIDRARPDALAVPVSCDYDIGFSLGELCKRKWAVLVEQPNREILVFRTTPVGSMKARGA